MRDRMSLARAVASLMRRDDAAGTMRTREEGAARWAIAQRRMRRPVDGLERRACMSPSPSMCGRTIAMSIAMRAIVAPHRRQSLAIPLRALPDPRLTSANQALP